MRVTLFSLLATLMAAIALPHGAHAQDPAADKAALEALVAARAQAIGADDMAALKALLTDGAILVPIDQTLIDSPQALDRWHDRNISGTYGMIGSIKVESAMDGPPVMLADGVALLRGTDRETYSMKSGETMTLTTRWTATAQRGADGGWKLASFQSGINGLDNPILQAVKSNTLLYAAGGLAWGLALGVIVGLFAGRKRRQTAGTT